jgi:hypothetical protein
MFQYYALGAHIWSSLLQLAALQENRRRGFAIYGCSPNKCRAAFPSDSNGNAEMFTSLLETKRIQGCKSKSRSFFYFDAEH